MPKYEEVYRDLREKILDGHYAAWGNLENEEILCKRYEVSRPTLQKAIARLKQDGFVHSRQGSGVFVNPPEFYSQSNLQTLSERFRNKDVKIENRVLLLERIPCHDFADMFHLEEAEELIHYERLRIVDGTPQSLEVTYMPSYLFPDFTEDVLSGSMMHYIETVCGYRISHDIKCVHPIIPDARIRELLDISDGRALLQVDHSVYSTRSVMLQYTEEYTVDPDIKIASVR